MLIILEGCDATGKTTLAEELVEAMPDGTELRHHGAPEIHPLLEWGPQVEAYQPGEDNWVMDRFHWGDPVYGPKYRAGDPRRLTPAQYYWLELAILARGGITVLFNGVAEHILERATALKDDFIDLELDHIYELLQAYRDVILDPLTVTFSGLTHTIDSTAIGKLLTPGEIMGHARVRQTTVQAARRVAPDLVGWADQPQALLVGETPSPSSGFNLPFVPLNNSSGHFLMETLIDLKLTRFALVNAVRGDGTPENLEELYYTLGQPNVVALGRIANDALEEAKVPHGYVQHPQFVKRFHHKKQERYAPAIGFALLEGSDTREMVTAK